MSNAIEQLIHCVGGGDLFVERANALNVPVDAWRISGPWRQDRVAAPYWCVYVQVLASAPRKVWVAARGMWNLWDWSDRVVDQRDLALPLEESLRVAIDLLREYERGGPPGL